MTANGSHVKNCKQVETMDDWKLEQQRCEQRMWERKEQSSLAML